MCSWDKLWSGFVIPSLGLTAVKTIKLFFGNLRYSNEFHAWGSMLFSYKAWENFLYFISQESFLWNPSLVLLFSRQNKQSISLAQALSQNQSRGRTLFQYSPVATVGTVPITALCYTWLNLSILNCHSVVQQVQEKAATVNSVRWWSFISSTIDFDGLTCGKVVYQLWDSRTTWLPRSEFPTKLHFFYSIENKRNACGFKLELSFLSTPWPREQIQSV